MTVEIYRYNHHSRSLAIHGDHLPACLKLNVPDLLAYWNELFPMVVFRKKVHTWNQKYRPDLPALQNFVSYKKVSKINLLKKIFHNLWVWLKISLCGSDVFFVSGLPKNRKKSPVRWVGPGDHSDGLIHRLIEVRSENVDELNMPICWVQFLKELRFNQCLIWKKHICIFFDFMLEEKIKRHYWTYIVHIISML